MRLLNKFLSPVENLKNLVEAVHYAVMFNHNTVTFMSLPSCNSTFLMRIMKTPGPSFTTDIHRKEDTCGFTETFLGVLLISVCFKWALPCLWRLVTFGMVEAVLFENAVGACSEISALRHLHTSVTLG